MAQEMNEQDVERFRQYHGTNTDFVNNQAFMMTRINPSPLLDKIRKDIGGKEIVIIDDPESPTGMCEKVVTISRALANDEGVVRLCNLAEETINTHTVQGNLKGDHYWEFIARFREEITDEIIVNCYDWGISDKDIDGIINKICRLVELFLTRPMDNKERESYQKEFSSREVIQQQQPKGGLMGFGHTR